METAVTDFTAWGIAADWPSLRWIESIQGRGDEPAKGVRLGHASDTAMVLTCTYPRARVDHEASVWGFDPVAEIAFETTYTQANLALHQVKPAERPEGLVGSLVSHAYQRAKSFREWPVTRWGEQAASTSSLASWQSGFSLDYPDAYVIVHACGIGIEQVEPVKLTDLSGYERSKDPTGLGDMHWELWPARPDFSCEELTAMLMPA